MTFNKGDLVDLNVKGKVVSVSDTEDVVSVDIGIGHYAAASGQLTLIKAAVRPGSDPINTIREFNTGIRYLKVADNKWILIRQSSHGHGELGTIFSDGSSGWRESKVVGRLSFDDTNNDTEPNFVYFHANSLLWWRWNKSLDRVQVYEGNGNWRNISECNTLEGMRGLYEIYEMPYGPRRFFESNVGQWYSDDDGTFYYRIKGEAWQRSVFATAEEALDHNGIGTAKEVFEPDWAPNGSQN